MVVNDGVAIFLPLADTTEAVASSRSDAVPHGFGTAKIGSAVVSGFLMDISVMVNHGLMVKQISLFYIYIKVGRILGDEQAEVSRCA